MRTIEVELTQGLTIGDVRHTAAVVREITTGDMLEASEESEKLVYTKNGAELMASPTKIGVHLLRRQIVKIGDHAGPLTLQEIKKLSSHDFNCLQARAQELENAALEVATRGRSDAPEEQD